MQAVLIFNENAGVAGVLNGNGKLTPETLQAALQEAGFFPVYQATRDENDLDQVLREVNDGEGLVVAAGGDGTVRAVITRLVDSRRPLAILPMGTANNVARTLGIEGDPLELIPRLRQARRRDFDVGVIEAPWGRDYFIEGAGFGYFADVLAEYDPEEGKSVLRSMKAITKTLVQHQTYPKRLWVDGETFSSEYLLVELLNTSAVGPRLKLAPDADPGDGLLDLVCIEESDREGFVQYARSMLAEDLDRLETVHTRKVQAVRFHWDGFPFHLDAEVRPHPDAPAAAPGEVSIRVHPAAVELWLPSEEER
jgi:diacylglycerol kinase family enzyme